jgi:hypothetical protein
MARNEFEKENCSPVLVYIFLVLVIFTNIIHDERHLAASLKRLRTVVQNRELHINVTAILRPI